MLSKVKSIEFFFLKKANSREKKIGQFQKNQLQVVSNVEEYDPITKLSIEIQKSAKAIVSGIEGLPASNDTSDKSKSLPDDYRSTTVKNWASSHKQLKDLTPSKQTSFFS